MRYIFLSYINRSGSTFLANMLSKSEEICVCPEAEILYDLFLANPDSKFSKKKAGFISRILANDKKFMLWNIPSEQLIPENKTCLEYFMFILNLFRELHYPKADYILYKHNYLINLTDNYNSADFTFINLIRDPRAVYASQYNTVSPFTRKPMSRNPLAFADSWNLHIEKVIEKQFLENVITLRYEDIVLTVEVVMEGLSAKLKLKQPWHNFKKNPSQLVEWVSLDYKKIHKHIDDLPKTDSLNRWESQVRNVCLAILRNTILKTQFYPEIKATKRSFHYWLYLCLFMIKRKYFYLKANIRNRIRKMFLE